MTAPELTTRNAANVRESLFQALDLPPEATALQDAYWQAEHEWDALDKAYHLVLRDLLSRVESRGFSEDFKARLRGE